MLPDLQSRYHAQQREVEAVIATASALAPDALVRVMAPGEWSALQIVGHLMLSSETVGSANRWDEAGQTVGRSFQSVGDRGVKP